MTSNTTETLNNDCDDGVQNGTETGVDCGGLICIPCIPQSGVPGRYRLPGRNLRERGVCCLFGYESGWRLERR